VIAAVTTGVYMGWHAPQLTTAIMRLQGVSVWEILTFLLNAVLFLLVGLQLPGVLDAVDGYSATQLLGWGALVSAVVVGVRLAWQFSVPYLVRALDRRPSQLARRGSAGERLVIGWAGMRGAVSLAAALAVPLTTDAGSGFPYRDLIILLALAVILVTLVGQGLTLGPLIDRLGIRDDGEEQREEVLARLRLSEAAIERLEEVGGEDWAREDTIERVRGLYDYRRRRFGAQTDGDGSAGYEERTGAYMQLMYELFDAQRERLLELRNRREISDEVRRKVERDLDLEESRLAP
jgi:monovalent cation/hydrogen antiporter